MKLDVLKPWIGKRVAEFIGMEDDVVVEFIFNQLEAKVNIEKKLTFTIDQRLKHSFSSKLSSL